MKLHYYRETDSLYIDLADRPSADSREIQPGIVLDFDAGGKLVGIDIEHASRDLALNSLDVDDLPLQPIGSGS
ncbi:DUF2283 domain-containing protein [Candidatus Sumerlaeota bacterium]|nr:DUF2283 domain-containing protein [Candidatus Sumerlaeota bacterium]MBI3737063.1 DUF2283 domain-containing protein [Candidatus Sumerlaeota bacterium]